MVNWRRFGFYTLDRLRGGRFRWHLDDLDQYFADPIAHAPVAEERMSQLLEHAVNTTEHYKSLQGAKDLRDFPVISKRLISEDPSSFISNAYDTSRLPRTTTSGSFGTPFTFLQTPEKSVRQRAEIAYFNHWAGLDIGDRHAFSGMAGRKKSQATLILQNELWMNPTVMNEEWLRMHCEALSSQQVTAFVGYPSSILALAQYSQSLGMTPADYSLQGIIGTGEPIEQEARQQIESAFGCRMLGRYSTWEQGMLAHECSSARAYHLNLSGAKIELLAKDEDVPVGPGELGRVVVTDFYSHAMPLIRYDTGDLAILGDTCPCGIAGPVFEHVVGRTVETIYSPNGTAISPFAINTAMSGLNNIIQFQFVQAAAQDYTLRLRTLPGFDHECDVKIRLTSILGDNANIAIDYVDDIPPLASGKRPYIINEYR